MKVIRVLPLIMCLIILVSIGGVYAIWQYSNIGPNPQKVEIPIDMDDFDMSSLTLVITNVEEITDETGNSQPTKIKWPRSVTATVNGSAQQKIVYKITAKNKAESGKFYCIGANSSVSNVDVAVSLNEDGTGVHPIKAAPGEEIVFYATYTLKSTINESELTVDFNFEQYAYAVTYVNDSQILYVDYVTEEESKNVRTLQGENIITNPPQGNYEFDYWMNAGSTEVKNIPARNTDDYILYPSYVNLYTATFVDQAGNVLAWDHFTNNNYSNIISLGNTTVPPVVEECIFDYWQVRVTKNGTTTIAKLSEYKFTDGVDVTIYPVYTYNGDVNLIPVDNNRDGITDEYHVGGYSNPNGQSMVEIPDYVNGNPITAIVANAFSSYDGVHSVVIPNTVITVGDNVLADDWGFLDSGETVTIYFEGSYNEWIAKEAAFNSDWDDGISESSRIFFLKDGKVDTTQGYMKATKSGSSIKWSQATITDALVTEYTGHCDCSISTIGDNAHVYVDTNGNIMKHNAQGTPINSAGVIIEYKRKNIFSSYKLTTNYNDTYYRYRPDRVYWLN